MKFLKTLVKSLVIMVYGVLTVFFISLAAMVMMGKISEMTVNLVQ
jgi:hypothetical protein